MDGQPRTSTSTLTQLLNYVHRVCGTAVRRAADTAVGSCPESYMTLVASEGNADGHGIKQLSPAAAPVQQQQSARCEAVQ